MHFDTVVVGGGAGGLELAARLGRQLGSRLGRERVLLVDRATFHIWKPTLHEVAAGTLDVHQEGLSYTVLARRNHFSFALGSLEALDAGHKTITLSEILDSEGGVIVPRRTVSFTVPRGFFPRMRRSSGGSTPWSMALRSRCSTGSLSSSTMARSSSVSLPEMTSSISRPRLRAMSRAARLCVA